MFLHLLGPPRHGVLEFVVGPYARSATQLWRSVAERYWEQLELFDFDLQLGLAGAILCDASSVNDSSAGWRQKVSGVV